MKRNLPHIYNSCWLNSLMILLSYTDVETENVMINKMLTYVDNQSNIITQEEIIQVMISFYKKFNMSRIEMLFDLRLPPLNRGFLFQSVADV